MKKNNNGMDLESFILGYAAGGSGGGGGGQTIKVNSLSVTKNGTYTAPSGKAYSPVTVDVDDADIIPHDEIGTTGSYIGYYIPEGTPSNRMTARIGITTDIADGVSIDWGDGTTETTDTAGAKIYSHTYASIPESGYYIQNIVNTGGGTVYFGGYTSGNSFITIYGDILTSYRYNQNRIKWVYIGDDIAYIQENSFQSTYGLIEVEIAKTSPMDSILASAFSACYSLKKIILPESANDTFEIIGNNAFYQCHSLQDIEFPDSLLSIGSSAFYGCYGFENVVIPDSVDTIDGNAFAYCRNMQDIKFPSNITTLNQSIIINCESLTSITIPSSVTSIKLISNTMGTIGKLRFEPQSPPQLSTTVLGSLSTDCVISVPTGKLNAYKTATNYPDPATYTYIEED